MGTDFKVLARNFGAAVLGYLVLAVVVMVGMTAAWFALGADRVFQPAVWDVTGTWMATVILVAVVGGGAGGWVCAKVGADARAVFVLLGAVLVLGILQALPEVAVPSGPRSPDAAMTEAAENAVEPRWWVWMRPFIGVVTVWLGARLAARRKG